MGKKRISPTNLVASAYRKTGTAGWHEKLPAEDRAYIRQVVRCLKDNPQSPIYSVASKLKDELGISVRRDQIAKTLKEMIIG